MVLLNQPPRDGDREHSCRLGEFVPMPASKCEEFAERFGIEILNELGGHTECTPMTMNRYAGPRKPGSSGAPLPYMEVKLFDDEDVEVPLGDVGEICVRPRATGLMFEGYWNNPDATAQTRSNHWHHTGDCGRFDDEGFLWFVDR
jgi:crotonobetaine/carnitine-CoA ligase